MKTFIILSLIGLALGNPLERENRAEGLNDVGNVSGGSVQVVGENSRIVGPSGSITTNFGDQGVVPVSKQAVAAVPVLPISHETIVSHSGGFHYSAGGPGISRIAHLSGGNVIDIPGDEIFVTSEKRYNPNGGSGGSGIGLVGDISGGNVVGVGGNGK